MLWQKKLLEEQVELYKIGSRGGVTQVQVAFLDDKNRKFKNGKFKVEFDKTNVSTNGIIFNQNDTLDFKINSDLNKKTSKINIISDINFANWQKVFKPEYIKGSSKLYVQLNTNKDQYYFDTRIDIKKICNAKNGICITCLKNLILFLMKLRF